MGAHLLQLLGFSDWATGTLSVCLTLGAALGFLTGGWLSDMLAYRFPNAARPFINQLSAAMVLPLTIVLYKAAPGETACHLAECIWPEKLSMRLAFKHWALLCEQSAQGMPLHIILER